MDNKNAEQESIESGRLYFQLNDEERESAIYFLLEAILKARDSEPELARSTFFDEDVNIYLAHLLFAMSLPEYHDMANPFLSNEPDEVLEWVRAAEDPMLRYFIFKVNADHRLIRSTVFSAKPPVMKRILFKGQRDGKNRLSVVYYEQAAHCHKDIYHKRTGVGEVLAKIAGHYEFYQRLLFSVRQDYFRYIDCFRDQAFRHFFLKLNHYAKQSSKEMILDRFLELYQKWAASKSPELKQKIIETGRELTSIDPQFRFDPKTMDREG